MEPRRPDKYSNLEMSSLLNNSPRTLIGFLVERVDVIITHGYFPFQKKYEPIMPNDLTAHQTVAFELWRFFVIISRHFSAHLPSRSNKKLPL